MARKKMKVKEKKEEKKGPPKVSHNGPFEEGKLTPFWQLIMVIFS